MIDFAIGLFIGALIVGAYFHFKGSSPSKATPTLDLETIVEGVRNLMSQAAEDLAAKIAALPAEFEAKFNVQLAAAADALAAEQADHAADLAKVGDAVTAITPDPAA